LLLLQGAEARVAVVLMAVPSGGLWRAFRHSLWRAVGADRYNSNREYDRRAP